MKECKYCGTEYEESVSTCPNCGASKIVTMEEKFEERKRLEEYKALCDAEKNRPSPEKTFRKIIWGIIGTIAIVIILSISISYFRSNTVITDDGRTEKDLDKSYTQAVTLLDSGKLEEGLILLSQIPDEYSKYEKVKKKKSEATAEYVTLVVGRLSSHIDNANYTEALKIVSDALELVGHDEVLIQKQAEILNLCKNEYLTKAEKLASVGDYDSALNTINALAIYIDNDSELEAKVLDYKKGKISTVLSQYEAKSDYWGAVTYLDNELLNINNDIEYVTKRDSYIQLHKTQMLEKADNYAAAGDYENAINTITQLISNIGTNYEFDAKIQEYNTSKLSAALSRYDDTGDYSGAINYLRSELSTSEDKKLINIKLDEYGTKYKTQLFAKAEQSYKTSGYDTAVSVLQEGLSILNADDEIQQKIQYYNDKAPVMLVDLTSIADEPYIRSNITDNYGNFYISAISNEQELYRGGTVEYLLNMQYDIFKGTLFIPDGDTNGGSSCLIIECDGVVTYTSPDMLKSSYPIEIELSVQGCNDIKIYFSGKGDGSYWARHPTLCLANPRFYPQP